MRGIDLCVVSPVGRDNDGSHGGITPVVTGISTGLAALGVRVELLCFYPDGAARARDWVSGSDVALTVLDAPRRHQARRALQRHLNETRPRNVLGAGHRFNALALKCARGGSRGPRLVLSVHNRMTAELASMRAVTRWRMKRLLRRQYPCADHLVAVSKGVADDLAKHVSIPAERLSVIHNPVINSRFRRLVSEPVEHPWLMESEGPVLLAAGRLVAQKNFSLLMRAFARLVEHRPCRLIILGEGPEREALQRLAGCLGIAEQVDMPGFAENPYACMAAASGFVLSSDWEGFGNVLAEALAAGTPVIATDCPSGPGEILDGGRHGTLVPVGDEDALAEAMEQLLAGRIVGPDPTATRTFTTEAAARSYRELLR